MGLENRISHVSIRIHGETGGMNKKDKIREQAFNYIIKEFNLLPYQEYIVREMWESKAYLAPVRGHGWSYLRTLLTVVDVLLKTR